MLRTPQAYKAIVLRGATPVWWAWRRKAGFYTRVSRLFLNQSRPITEKQGICASCALSCGTLVVLCSILGHSIGPSLHPPANLW